MVDNYGTLEGRLTYDPKLFSTRSGKSCVIFGIACGSKEHTEFLNVKGWGKLAENVASYTKKGSEILVLYHLHQNEKEVNGKIEYELEIVADSVKFLGSKTKEEKKQQEAFETVDDLLDSDQLPF